MENSEWMKMFAPSNWLHTQKNILAIQSQLCIQIHVVTSHMGCQTRDKIKMLRFNENYNIKTSELLVI